MAEEDKDLEQRLRDLQAHVDRVQQAQQEVQGAVSGESRPAGDAGGGADATGDDAATGRTGAGPVDNRQQEAENERQLERLRQEREELEQRLSELRASSTGG